LIEARGVRSSCDIIDKKAFLALSDSLIALSRAIVSIKIRLQFLGIGNISYINNIHHISMKYRMPAGN
jgi:hypothetical protein